MHVLPLFAISAATLLLLTGCQTPPSQLPPKTTTKYTIESTNKFILTDKASQACITCTGIQERMLADGRLEVVANIKNHGKSRIKIQISCAFRDDTRIATGDEPAWQIIDLVENSTETIRFTPSNHLETKYTIRVRQDD